MPDDDFPDEAERAKMRAEADRLRTAAESEPDPKKRADMIIEAKGLEFLDIVGFHHEHGPEGVGESEEDERLRCLLLGVRLDEEAQKLRELSRSWYESREVADEEPRHRELVRQQTLVIGGLLDDSVLCGNERNGYLQGEFGDLPNMARESGAKDVLDAAENFAKELREGAAEPEVALGIEPFSRRVVQ